MLNSSNNFSQPEIQICFRFKRGQCSRGRSCRFLHLQESDTGNNVGISSQSSLYLAGPVASKIYSTGGSSEKKICRHFFEKGWCAFADSCRYSHSVLSENEVELDAAAEDTNSLSESYGDRVEIQQASARKGDRKLCRFFQAGYCRLGKRCRFQHVEAKSKSPGEFHSDDSVESSKVNAELLNSENRCNDAAGSSITASQDQYAGSMCRLKIDSSCELAADKHIPSQDELNRMRNTEIQQLRLRYHGAQETRDDSGQVGLKFVFEPTDPDWPYDVKCMTMEVIFPENYPAQMMIVRITDNERIPDTVERCLTDCIQDWVGKRYSTTVTSENWQLLCRPMLRWFDRNAENLMTGALQEYKRELIAKAAGVQFIPAAKLREIYPDAVSDRRDSAAIVTDSIASPVVVPSNIDDNTCTSGETNPKSDPVLVTTEKKDNEESCASEKPSGTGTVSIHLSATGQKGTEVSLTGLQLTDGAATLVASQITLVVACSRCTNTSEARLVPGHAYRATCVRCHISQLMEFSATIVHQMSSVVGWLNLDGCRAFDLALADCQFNIGCVSCSKEEKINSVSPGHPNSTWCRHCHQKLTVFVECVRFVQLSASVEIDASKAIQLDVKKPVKAVRDPAIQEGQPLPDNGTCKHYKKSFRWLRFPCCGKAYPCDRCHNEKETDHEMKLANRMICGFCAKEQPYASERPCTSCSSSMTNKSTSHWEGGRGCRDKIKMSRNDSKKFANSSKTVPSSSDGKVDTSKKITKLRHI